jgi:hypothetical protein
MAESRPRFADADLDRALRAVAAEIAWPPAPDLAPAVRQRITAQPARPRPWWLPTRTTRWRLALAIVLLLFLLGAVFGAIPPVRKGIARRLGLENVQIVNVTAVPTPTAMPIATPLPTLGGTASPAPTSVATATPPLDGLIYRANLGTRTILTEAQSRVSYAIRTPGLPGYAAPDEVYVRAPPVGGRVTLLYLARPDLPPIGGSDIGLLIQEFKGGIDAGLFQKGVGPSTKVEPVTVRGAQGYWITGGLRAFAYTDANGAFQFEEIRSAGNTLLWQENGIVYRIETSLPQPDALRIASSLQ